jgi:hypothetical protein
MVFERVHADTVISRGATETFTARKRVRAVGYFLMVCTLHDLNSGVNFDTILIAPSEKDIDY